MKSRVVSDTRPVDLDVASSTAASAAPRIVIIGGGLAGMAAADALLDSPAHVTLLESRRRTGGRAGSFFDPSQRQDVDYCQHVAMGCCTNFMHLMQKHGVADCFERVKELTFLSLDGTACSLAPSPWLPAPLHFAPGFLRLGFLSVRQRREIAAGVWRLMRTAVEDVAPEVVFDQWLREQGQSADTIDRFWDVFITSALGEAISRVAFGPARKVFIDGFLAARGAADLLIPRQPLSQLFGARLPGSLEALGAEIRTSTAASSLVADPDRVTGVRTSDGQVVSADRVIVAVPWHGVHAFVSPSYSHFPASPISSVHLWFDRPITQREHAVVTGGLCQWLFRPSSEAGDDSQSKSEGDNANGDVGGDYCQVVISASRDVQRLGQEATIATICRELATLFPAARQAKLLRWRVVTDPRAVFSVCPATESERPGPTTAHPGIFLAGDYTRTGWPATMEGAVVSGYQAADAVRRSLDWKPFPPRPPLPRTWLTRHLIKRGRG